ncbi:TPA: hypothetical protein I9009_001731 [Clostridium perfringens]|nr:hypothetical protein [Clostridium perfringens]
MLKNRIHFTKILGLFFTVFFIGFNIFGPLVTETIIKKQSLFTTICIILLVFIFTDTFETIIGFYILLGITMLLLTKNLDYVEGVLLNHSLPGSIPIIFKSILYEMSMGDTKINLNLLTLRSVMYIVILYCINSFALSVKIYFKKHVK